MFDLLIVQTHIYQGAPALKPRETRNITPKTIIHWYSQHVRSLRTRLEALVSLSTTKYKIQAAVGIGQHVRGKRPDALQNHLIRPTESRGDASAELRFYAYLHLEVNNTYYSISATMR